MGLGSGSGSGRDDDGACVGDPTDDENDNKRAEPPAEGVDECTVGTGDGYGDRAIRRHDTTPEFEHEFEYEVGTESHGVNHTKALSGGAGADKDSAFEGKQPDGHAPNLMPLQPTNDDANDGEEGDVVRDKKALDDSGCGGGGSDDGGSRGVEVEVEVERNGGGTAAGVRDHGDEFSGREGEGINQNYDIDEGDLDAHHGFVDDGASSAGQVDYANDDEIAAEPLAEGDEANTLDNAQSKNCITFLARLGLHTSILRRREHHLQIDQHANTQGLQAALHALQDMVDREVEVCLVGVGAQREPRFEGGEYDFGAVELEKKQNGKRRRRLSEEEDGSQEEDGVDDFGKRQGSENFSVGEPPRSRFKRARLE
ncbi:hypothetical protein GALMADRAFT_216642 [Galerina marginata CBS 339.88]|uniref:Uncharacterized protein n=1 Tax=Galerina marginata (strain CBS 339.88) TaxID=685588 RepID=A0A067SB27_GALM3|nr:hypothetical protein GALMADRAFT_216642 [Galerina marginata CBS 339.88]